ncbi:MAG: phosphodiester glycosidase family protein, partial [Oscillospiraceae bacterium]|nr:phosphodiester glycosidase family protein [Oscillospiraceae bacterium]
GVVTTEPTSTTEGVKTFTCATCGDTYTETVDALGHTEETIPAVAPDCENTGLTEGVKCSVCGEVLKAQEEVAALGHKYDGGVVTTEPTCTTEGVKTFTCATCGDTYTKTVPVIDHKYVTDQAVPPTCTETGLTIGRHCEVCGYVSRAQEIVPATNHKNKRDVAETAPTCTATGLTAGVYCPDCDTWLTPQNTIPATGHTEETVKGYDATCVLNGRTDGVKCTVCGETVVAQQIIAAKGHNNVTEAQIDPTCTEIGYTETVYCDRCDMVLKRKVEIPAKGHTEKITPAVAPTCENTGLTEGKYCSVCDTVILAQETVAATGHSYDNGVVTTKPTCTEEGVKTFTCYNDKAHTYTEPVDPLGHTEEEIPAVAPKCEEVGYTAGVKCAVCDIVLVEPEEIEAKGHSWNTGRVTVEPTCEDDGERTFTCTTCRDEKVEPEAALGHDYITVPAKKPTYTENGWDEYQLCQREDCGYTTRVIIPALGEPSIENFDEFISNLATLESMANEFVRLNPGKDPAMLVIKYIRTGVDRYNSGSWNIMAGYEDEDFRTFVEETEKEYNLALEDGEELMKVTGMKNLKIFRLPNGDKADIGHVFGTMDISYTNKTSINHHDVAGWAGDTVDLMSVADQFGLAATDLDGMVEEIKTRYFLKDGDQLWAENGEKSKEGSFGQLDIDGDLDGYYIMQTLLSKDYQNGTLTSIFADYMTPGLTNEKRAEFFLKNRLNGVTDRQDIRDAVFAAYTANSVIATLEGTREYNATDLSDLRRAVCYVFADYICKYAGDYVEITDNSQYEKVSSERVTLAPGITQEMHIATMSDGKQIKYYVATGDITSQYVDLYANYNKNDPSLGWAMSRVRDQANDAQSKYGDPASPNYIPNYSVTVAVNGAGFNMTTGEPGGVLVMGGVEYHAPNAAGFFGILKNGQAVIGTTEEYNTIYKGQVQEAIAGFGTVLVKDGKILNGLSDAETTDRASRTAAGITKTGKVVLLVVDGRQEPVSCGGTMREIAQMMLEAGCVQAINLDGGGSTTYVARQPGDTELTVVNRPSDGFERSVATSLMLVSTAPASDVFDHAIVDSDYNYLTIGSTAQLSAVAVSVMGNSVEMPAGVVWTVSDETIGTIDANGVFTAKADGKVTVNLMLDGKSVGSRELNVIVPNNVYFEKSALNAIYGQPITLPVKAIYNGKDISFNMNDIVIQPAVEGTGTVNGFDFTADEACGLKQIVVNAYLAKAPECTASITLKMFRADEASFDFDNATGGDMQLAWDRVVSNSVEESIGVYRAVDATQDMVTSYTFAIDMSKIDIPQQLVDLVDLLPGGDQVDATAWGFLMQLAERVSVLTTVEPVIVFDKNMDVDFSAMSVSNEYFALNAAKPFTFDEETNTLTL